MSVTTVQTLVKREKLRNTFKKTQKLKKKIVWKKSL